jgi:hypothetical protein
VLAHNRRVLDFLSAEWTRFHLLPPARRADATIGKRNSLEPDMRLILKTLLAVLVVLVLLVTWAWWYYRPTIEWATGP